MAISSTGSTRLQQRPPVRAEAPEVDSKGAPFKGNRSESKAGSAAGAVQNGDALRKAAAAADGFDAAQTASVRNAQQPQAGSVVDQLNGASTFEDCAPEPAVALALPDGSVVGATLTEAKGSRSDSSTGLKTDGEDCSPATIGEVGVMA